MIKIPRNWCGTNMKFNKYAYTLTTDGNKQIIRWKQQ